MDNVSVSSQPPQPPAIPLTCGCIRGEFLCVRAARLWQRFLMAHTVIGADNAWNRYWRHYGASEMYR